MRSSVSRAGVVRAMGGAAAKTRSRSAQGGMKGSGRGRIEDGSNPFYGHEPCSAVGVIHGLVAGTSQASGESPSVVVRALRRRFGGGNRAVAVFGRVLR